MITLTAAMIYPGLLVFARATGLLLLLPVFSGATIPMPVRVALAAMLAWIVGPMIGAPGALPAHWLAFVLVLVHELLAGLLMGLAARMLFFALELGGQIISTEIGLIMSSNIDPITHASSSPANTMLFSFGTILFLLTGAHHYSLAAFVRSFEIFPPTAAFDPATADFVIAQSARVFLIAVQIAAPLLAVNFVVNLAFAALGRAAPTLDVYASSFPVRILVGLTVFGMTFALIAQYMLGELRASPERMLHFLR
jgi:flagellar biosynthetic protein FliR